MPNIVTLVIRNERLLSRIKISIRFEFTSRFELLVVWSFQITIRFELLVTVVIRNEERVIRNLLPHY